MTLIHFDFKKYPLSQIQQILVLPVSEEKLILLKVFQDSLLLIGARNEFKNYSFYRGDPLERTQMLHIRVIK